VSEVFISKKISDTLPCRHNFPSEKIAAAKTILQNLSTTNPELLQKANISDEDWLPLLRAVVENMRGTTSASGADKSRFIKAILQHCEDRGLIESWNFIGNDGRQDYRVDLPGGFSVSIEAKGCPDGNNTTIWDRPSWADEFVVWSQCPESLAHPPGKGVWSGISTRLMPKITAERKVVDAFIFWDGRCGTQARPCPKNFGVSGNLRATATKIPGENGKENWLPPPCIFLFPQSWPQVPNNTKPRVHSTDTCRFARMLLEAFEVPSEKHAEYVHEGRVEARGTQRGTEILVTTISRCWPDGRDRSVAVGWKAVKRET
jgi:hypothetical protein